MLKFRKNKFGNKKTNGYDSAKESKRAAELKLMERAGVIENLQEQVVFELQPAFQTNWGKKILKMSYIPDFYYFDKEKKRWIAEDVKGFRTPDYVLKAKIFQYVYRDIEFIEIGSIKKKKKKCKINVK